jgi:hypothetical protein
LCDRYGTQGLNLPDGEVWYDIVNTRFFMTPDDLAAAKRAQTATAT